MYGSIMKVVVFGNCPFHGSDFEKFQTNYLIFYRQEEQII